MEVTSRLAKWIGSVPWFSASLYALRKQAASPASASLARTPEGGKRGSQHCHEAESSNSGQTSTSERSKTYTRTALARSLHAPLSVEPPLEPDYINSK